MHGAVPAHRRDGDGDGIKSGSERRSPRGRRGRGFEPRRRRRRGRRRRRRAEGKTRRSPPASRFPAPKFCASRAPSPPSRSSTSRGARQACLGARTRPNSRRRPRPGARGGAVDDERDAAALETRGRGADGALRAFDDGVVAVVQRGRDRKTQPARTSTSSTGGKMDRRASWARAAANEATAFVGVASAEAIRVYPAHGAARGERHTVKKASAEEPLVAAALVAPSARRRHGSDDTDDVITGDGPAHDVIRRLVTVGNAGRAQRT